MLFVQTVVIIMKLFNEKHESLNDLFKDVLPSILGIMSIVLFVFIVCLIAFQLMGK